MESFYTIAKRQVMFTRLHHKTNKIPVSMYSVNYHTSPYHCKIAFDEQSMEIDFEKELIELQYAQIKKCRMEICYDLNGESSTAAVTLYLNDGKSIELITDDTEAIPSFYNALLANDIEIIDEQQVHELFAMEAWDLKAYLQKHRKELFKTHPWDDPRRIYDRAELQRRRNEM